jgi:NAD(P)H dehydrogenase (quinone)
MKITVILAHPNPDSFNAAIAAAACQETRSLGHDLRFHDLYQERFDPLVPLAELDSDAVPAGQLHLHCREIAEAGGIVLVHPNWWGQPPAILKGWVDRVLRPGVAYRFLEGDNGEGVPVGLLKARTAVIFNTSNTPREREMAVFKDPLQNLWETCILEFCGVRKVVRTMFGVMVTSTPAERAHWLEDVKRIIRENFSQSPVE